MELAAALKEAQKALAEALTRRADVDAQIADLEVEVQGLTLALSRQGPQVLIWDSAPSDWSDMPRTTAIAFALQAASEPLGPKAITEVLHEHGRDDDRDLVAASLAHLKNQERVHSVGYGQWVAGPPPDDSDPGEGRLS